MPHYYDYGAVNKEENIESAEKSNRTTIALWKPLLVLTFFYYLITCGVERIYQPMVSKRIDTFRKYFCRILQLTFISECETDSFYVK